MALLIMENKVDFPKTAYMTALDVYLIVCFGFILSSIIEFAWVHYATNLIHGKNFKL
jgi:gamma-aminobutyric acid receptor subunit alpha